MESISYLTHSGPHGWRYRQAMRTTILLGITELSTSRIRALWTAIQALQFVSHLSPHG